MVDNCFNCEHGKEVKSMFFDTSNLARCRNPESGKKSGLKVGTFSKIGKRHIYLIVTNETPKCWIERKEEPEIEQNK